MEDPREDAPQGVEKIPEGVIDALGIESATFRLLAYGAGSASGTLDVENFQTLPNRGIAVHGTAAVPESNPAILLMVAAAWRWLTSVLKWLRRKNS